MKLSWIGALVLSLEAFGAPLEPMLIGGRDAEAGDFPEVIYISSGNSRCTATVIGPKVILTAAHCISDGGVIRPASFVVKQTVYRATCTHHSKYSTEYSYDFALCKVDQELDLKYASISNEGPELNKDVTLIGYGCVKQGGGGGNNGQLKYGEAEVISLPGVAGDGGQYYYTQDDTALCFGDSGGPSMLLIGNPKKDTHKVIGLNSRGNIRDLSLMASTYLPGFRDYAEKFEQDNDVEICGISKDCLDGGKEQKPNPKCRYYKYKMDKYHKKYLKYKGKYKQCQVSFTDLDKLGLANLPFIR